MNGGEAFNNWPRVSHTRLIEPHRKYIYFLDHCERRKAGSV